MKGGGEKGRSQDTRPINFKRQAHTPHTQNMQELKTNLHTDITTARRRNINSFTSSHPKLLFSHHLLMERGRGGEGAGAHV